MVAARTCRQRASDIELVLQDVGCTPNGKSFAAEKPNSKPSLVLPNAIAHFL
jgi:hypothetical protein